MTVARSVARAVASPVARAVVGIGGNFNASTDYFARVEAAGGSFDLSAVNATYTAAYIKAAHETLINGLIADGLWSLMQEVYLFCGKTWAGRAIKVKGTGQIASFGPIVSADWVRAGVGAGVKGDGASHVIDTGFSGSNLANDDFSLSVYKTTADTVTFRYFIATRNTTDATYRKALSVDSVAASSRFISGTTAVMLTEASAGTGMVVGSRRSATDAELYRNGASADTDTTTATLSSTNGNLFILAAGDGTSGHSNSTIAFAHAGRSLTDAQQSALASRVNAFMTAIGANVY